jgi:hypothetical protein
VRAFGAKYHDSMGRENGYPEVSIRAARNQSLCPLKKKNAHASYSTTIPSGSP